MNKILALALAAAVAYALGDLFRPYLPNALHWAVLLALTFGIYKFAVRYLDALSS